MCGIVGIYLKSKKFEKDLGKMLSGMLVNMESRGPDSAGFAIYKKEKKEEFKYSICINNLVFEKFKKDISKKIKYNSILKNSDHAILCSKEKPEIVLSVAGVLFVLETLSVMLQVTYFKITKGKRLFFYWV